MRSARSPVPRVRSRRLVRLARGLVLGLSALVLVFAAATRIVHLAWNHERAARTISTWVSSTLAGQGGATHQAFTFGRVDYPWADAVVSLLGGPPVRFDAWDIHIWDPAGNEVWQASHVEAGLRLDRLVWAQLWGALPGTDPDLELHFVGAVVDRLRCRIELPPGGEANLVAAFARRPDAPPGSGGGMVISVEGAQVRDGQYRMRFPGWEGELEHLRLALDSLRYSSFPAEQRDDSPAFTYQVSRVVAPTGRLTLFGVAFPMDHVAVTDFHAQEPRRQDMVLKATAQSRGSTVAVDGRLAELYTAGHRVELQMNAQHGAGVLAGLPSRDILGGDVFTTAHLHGPFADVVIDGDGHGAELHVGGLDIHRIGGSYRLAGHVLHLGRLTSDVAGGHARGEATLDWNARSWRTDLEVDGIQVLELGALVPLGVLAWLSGIPMLVVHAGDNDAGSAEKFHFADIDLTLYRHPGELLPHRVAIRGSLGPRGK